MSERDGIAGGGCAANRATTPADVRPGVWFQGGLGVTKTVELAVLAEAAGVNSVWLAEGPIARDAFVTLGAVAARTDRVALGTGIVNPHTRHPAQLAAAFATLDELSGGRAICGLGIGARDFLIPIGADVSKPLATAREAVSIVRQLIARESVRVAGAKFRLDGVRLGFRPARERIPIYLAANGPKMCELAGEVADGIYLMYGAPEYVSRCLELSRRSRSRAEPLAVASPILMAVDDDSGTARARVKRAIGLMLTEPNGERTLEANGLDPSLAQRIRDGLREGGVRALLTAVDDAIVDTMTIVGPAATCVRRLAEVVSCGVDEPQILLTGEDPEPTFRVLRELRRELA